MNRSRVDMLGNQSSTNMSFLAATTKEECPAGIPSMGIMVAEAKKECKKDGFVYVKDSLYVISIIKLTKAQFDALSDEEEPQE